MSFSATTSPRFDAARAALAHPERGPALLILVLAFDADPRVWGHVTDDYLRIDFRTILDQPTWSRGERLLLELAASLADRGQRVDFGALRATLSDHHWRVAARAMLQAHPATESLGKQVI